MRRYICLIIVLCGYVGCFQNKEGLYDFTELPQSLMLNPGADVNFEYHAGVPFLSHFHFNIGIKGVSLYDVFADDGRDINEKIKNTLSGLGRNDYLTLTQQLEIVNFGWKSKKNNEIYYSGGVYEELDLIGYFPKDFAVLAYEGNKEYLNRSFRFSNISATGELLTVYHFGYSKKVNSRLVFGARGKIYSSIINIRSTGNRGTFTTIETPDGINLYQHVISGADVTVRTAGYASLRDIESNDDADGANQVAKKFINRALLGGNIGIGIDIGFTYKPEEQWTITGSAIDLGLINYSKDVETYRAGGNYTFNGFEPSGGGTKDFVDELKAAIPFDTISRTYVAFRPLKLNGSLKYSFNEFYDGSCNCGTKTTYMDAVGLQLFTQIRPKIPQYAASVFYYKQLSSFFKTKFTYTLDEFSWYNIGLLFSAHINKFNLYISANNLLDYSNLAKSRGVSLQFGFNVIM